MVEFFKNNFMFYEGLYQSNYNVVDFGKRALKGRWSGENVMRYLAFRVVHYPKPKILNVLDKEFPKWESEFHKQVEIWERNKK